MVRQDDGEAAARLAAIVESSFDAIVSKDLDSRITSWNPAAERLFGYASEEAIGQSVLMLIPPHLQAEEADIISRIRDGERVASFETTRLRKDGSPVMVSLTVSPIRSASGTIIGASKIARDITAAIESRRRIKLLMREVNHRVKNQFSVILAMVKETSRRSPDPVAFEQDIRSRIMSLARSHDLLVESDWKGASLVELVQEHLKPFAYDMQISIAGPLLTLQATAVQHLGMALHELATNSSKYGALATGIGAIEIAWQITDTPDGPLQFHFSWDETSGQPASGGGTDGRSGFGTVVLKRVAPQALNGTASLEHEAGHLRWSLTAPLDTVATPSVLSPGDE